MCWTPTIIAILHVIMSPTKLPRIHRQNTRRKPTVYCSFEQRHGKFIVMWHVQLEKPNPALIRFADVFNRLAACSTKTVWQVELSSYLSDRQFACWVVNLVDTDWRETDWSGDGMPETRPGCVAVVCIDEHTWDNAVAVEGLSVCGMCGGLSGVGRGIEPATL